MYDRTEEYVLRSVPKGSEILDLNRTRGSGVFNLEMLILVLFPKKKKEMLILVQYSVYVCRY